MVVMFQTGRLGNQLFQYAAIRATKPHESFCPIGMNQLKSAFQCPAICPDIAFWRAFQKICRAIGYKRLRQIVRVTRIANVMSEVRRSDHCEVKLERGLLPSLTFCETGFYQYPELVYRTPPPDFKSEILAKAEQALLRTRRNPRNIYFLHHRRGDYFAYPSMEHPAVLPQAWYEAQITTIRNINPEAVFMAVGDDTAYLRDVYQGRVGFFLPGGDEATDLAIMSLSQGGGILSASSFAWWGAYLSYNRFGCGSFLAPEFWIGHPQKSWYPAYIKTSWINYATVE